MIPDDIERIVARLAGQRVLVVGDMFLDEYLVGRAVRLSREAPWSAPTVSRCRAAPAIPRTTSPRWAAVR